MRSESEMQPRVGGTKDQTRENCPLERRNEQGRGRGARKDDEEEKQSGKDGKIREVCASSVIPRGNLIS